MSNDRHINFKLLREQILASQAKATRTGGDPSATADGTDLTALVARPDLGFLEGDTKPGVGASKEYWRSLDELADSPEFHEFVLREYPQQAEEWNDPVERRTFLKLMGASLALAGLSSCAYQPPEKIVPYVNQPEEEVPGKPLYFATAFSLGGIATPLLARSNEGRPTKVEGNPDHPNNRSSDPHGSGATATDIFAQASILSLYDPDRAQTLSYREEIRPWSAFVGEIRGMLNGPDGNSGLKAKQGAGLRILTETITSPTLAAQLKGILTELPQAKWHQYEPANRDNVRAGAMIAFGQPVNTIYDFSKADVVLSLGSDFLAALPGTLRYARDWAARRRVTKEREEMSRLYLVENTPTTTGASADHRLALRPSEMVRLTQAVLAQVRAGEGDFAGLANAAPPKWLYNATRDLMAHKGSSLVIVGDDQPPVIHALAHALNDALGNVSKTVFYTDPVEANSVDQSQSLRELINDIDGGQVELLVILGGNPVYNSPLDLKLDPARLGKVKLRVHLSQTKDETSDYCHWHVPETHYLEAWTDARSYDGTATIVQPLIAPLFEGKTAHEVLAVFTDNYDRKPYELLRDYWRGQFSGAGTPSAGGRTPPADGRRQAAGAGVEIQSNTNAAATGAAIPTTSTSLDFESWWRQCVHDGFVPNSALPVKSVSVNSASVAPATGAQDSSAFELAFRTDPTIYDGRFANNGWLQELPKPLTKITWDNAAMISPATARQLGIGSTMGRKGGDIYVDQLTLNYSGRSMTVPTWIMPGQPDGVITIHLGYGRKRAGRVGSNQGFNAYCLRTSNAPWGGPGLQVSKAAGVYQLAQTQTHFNMEGRDLLRSSSLEEYKKDKHKLREESEHEQKELHDRSMYPDYDYKNQGNGLDYAWGMAIDLNSCIGCNGCVVACQSENNIPIVGKEQIVRSREMHWIRVDTYFKGEAENPEGPFFQPVPCMHCENAPCEPVCPVHATVHSAEGLNDMVYNRCVGTRYCSNNCPYKVRRFNFLLYQDFEQPLYQLMRNPEVTVRSRGVMEKCTYCVQRIQTAKIDAELEGRPVRDGEIVTACQSVCPTEAIVFGNVNDPNSKVSRLKAEERNYSLLAELNTRPRTTYLSALRHPNPEIEE
jgi:MoCo/4Fe-4S cofactor protein with predicted Tat translocation signal